MLFDTDVLIWAFRGSKKAAKEIDDDDSRFISAVNYMELMQGARTCGIWWVQTVPITME